MSRAQHDFNLAISLVTGISVILITAALVLTAPGVISSFTNLNLRNSHPIDCNVRFPTARWRALIPVSVGTNGPSDAEAEATGLARVVVPCGTVRGLTKSQVLAVLGPPGGRHGHPPNLLPRRAAWDYFVGINRDSASNQDRSLGVLFGRTGRVWWVGGPYDEEAQYPRYR